MEPEFIYKVIASIVVGGSWVAGSTVLVDKLGTKTGGLIAGLPSTVVVALFFIGLSQGTSAVVAATTVVPLTFAVNGPFLLAYAALAKRGWWHAMVPAVGIWFGLSYLIIVFRPDDFFWGVVICGLVLTLVTVIFERAFNASSAAGHPHPRRSLRA